ncbi:MAG: DUF655 domain-containing protein [Thermoproteota archaeon]|jgi:Predicted RNA-binding protein
MCSYYIKKKFYYEDFVYILAYNIPQKNIKEKKHPMGFPKVKEVYSQALGKDHFTLLEVVSDYGVVLQKGELVYAGKYGRTKIKRISARLIYEELVDEAKIELDNILRQIVKTDEQRFVEFFNTAGPVSPRTHSLELFERIGKKTVEKILFERSRKKFESYADIKNRCGISNIEEIIYERLRLEITSKEKLNYYLFAKGIENTLEERYKII